MTLAAASPTKTLSTCSLCGLTTLHPLVNDAGEVFCCPSCREVAALLAESPREEARGEYLLEERRGRSLTSAQEVTITLGGMYCPSCAWLVEERLKRTKGVVSAEVNYIQRQASIAFDASIANYQSLKKRIRSLGYQAALPDEKPHDEEESFFMRLAICSALALHDVIVGGTIYARELLGLASAETEWLVDFFRLMMLVTAIPVLLLLGLPILRAGLASLLRGQPNIHTLITIGTFSAFGISLWNYARGHTSQIYFDTASMLIYLISIGHWLEMQAHKAGSEAVERLLQQIPATAALVTAGGEKEIAAAELKPGMRVRVRPGERFPVDGLIASGEGDVDASLLTGEPRPVTKREGDAAQAGTISLDGSFEVIASAVGAATAAGQIGRLLHEALWNRSPLERLADKMSAWLTYGAVALAGIAFLFWNYQSGAEHALLVALTVLLIACPCALGLATPLTLWLALGRAADSGAILRSTGAIERLARVKKIFFDKTGTLTTLPMQVKEIVVEPSSPALPPRGEESSLPHRERARVREGSSLPLRERARVREGSSLPLRERARVREGSSLPLRERARVREGSSLPLRERARVREGSSLPLRERARVREGSSLSHRERDRVRENAEAKEFLRIVASIENQSEHPLAKAIVSYARRKRIKLAKPASFAALPGRGVIGQLPITNYQLPIVIGSERLMTENNLRLSASLAQKADAFRAAGMIVVFAGWEGQARGLIALGETARPETAEAVNQASARGLRLEVLTGDEAQAGRRWQEALGIPVHAGLRPEEKLARIRAETDAAMVGDGINDGPALAAASVGLAMNHGTDVAGAAADVVLMREDLRLIPWLVDLSRHAMRKVRQNLGWAVVYNLIGVALAMAGLLTPLLAALAMVLSSVIVTANAMRLRTFPPLKVHFPAQESERSAFGTAVS